MTLPTKQKTWQYVVNIPLGVSDDFNVGAQTALKSIKDALIGFGSNPWTVWGSCDGNTGTGIPPGTHFGNNDGVDRWDDRARVNWVESSGNHSWMVLKQTGLGTNTCICFDCITTAQYANKLYMWIWLLPTGVSTPGTLTTRPRASDEVALLSDSYWGAHSTLDGCIHVMQSTDGQCTRVVFSRGNYAGGLWLFDHVSGAPAAWTAPVVGLVDATAGASDRLQYSTLNDVNTYCKGRLGSNLVNFYLAAEGVTTTSVGEWQIWSDDDTGEYHLSPVQLACANFLSRGVYKGTICDLWWGSADRAIGTCYPDDTSKQFAQFGHLVFPWNGSTPQVG